MDKKMTDLEMTKLCAEAIGFYENAEDITTPDGEVFAEIADYPVRQVSKSALGRRDPMSAGGVIDVYDPIHWDVQAMALVKKFGLAIHPPYFDMKAGWHVWKEPRPNCTAIGHDLNRAIVECVAKMQVDRTESVNRGTATLNKSLYG